jgi:hypothetical protein
VLTAAAKMCGKRELRSDITCTAATGVHSHAVPVALAGECPMLVPQVIPADIRAVFPGLDSRRHRVDANQQVAWKRAE